MAISCNLLLQTSLKFAEFNDIIICQALFDDLLWTECTKWSNIAQQAYHLLEKDSTVEKFHLDKTELLADSKLLQ